VLHLEDNPWDAELVQHRLDLDGLPCDVTMANGQDSFEAALARDSFDVILSDYNLPGYDGITALKWAQERHPDIPVIIISGTLGEEEAVKCLQIGATDYLLKGHLDRLVPAVQRALHDAQARRTRKRTEQVLVQREQALRENEERTNFALAAAGMGVWELEFATQRLMWSETMAPVFGLTADQAPRTQDEFIQLIHPDDRPVVKASVDRAITGESDYAVEFRTVWPDGTTHWIQGRAQVSFAEDGTPLRFLGIGIDVTARKVLEGRVEQAQKIEAMGQEMQFKSVLLEAQNLRIQSASRLKSEFLANMSHELRTPLNAIIGFAELMHKGKVGPVSSQHHEYLGDILSSSKHLLQLINDVLDLAKIESGRMEFRPEWVDLAKLVREVRDILRGLAASKRLHVNTHVDAAIPMVFVDPARVKQILFNYLSNAIKFTAEEGTVAIRIMLEGPDWFRIDVEDTGIGIPADDLGSLFVEFQQLDAGSAKRHQGTGLGLALTKRLAEAHGGRVAVRSTPGGGSTFSAILPCVTTMASAEDVALPVGPSFSPPMVMAGGDDLKAHQPADAAVRES
jgi:PAS domain S-box-containing protein